MVALQLIRFEIASKCFQVICAKIRSKYEQLNRLRSRPISFAFGMLALVKPLNSRNWFWATDIHCNCPVRAPKTSICNFISWFSDKSSICKRLNPENVPRPIDRNDVCDRNNCCRWGMASPNVRLLRVFNGFRDTSKYSSISKLPNDTVAVKFAMRFDDTSNLVKFAINLSKIFDGNTLSRLCDMFKFCNLKSPEKAKLSMRSMRLKEKSMMANFSVWNELLSNKRRRSSNEDG